MFVPELLPFVLLFLIASPQLKGETNLYDELKFLESSSKSVKVYLPGEEQPEVVEDKISTIQSGIQKKPVKSESYDTAPKPRSKKKRLRFRSR